MHLRGQREDLCSWTDHATDGRSLHPDATMTLVPVHKEIISPEVMQAQEWGPWDSWSWQDLTSHDNAVLLSDSKEFTGGIQIAPASDLPRWQQSYVPYYVAATRVTMGTDTSTSGTTDGTTHECTTDGTTHECTSHEPNELKSANRATVATSVSFETYWFRIDH